MLHAEKADGRILAGETGKIWCGANAGTVKLMEKWIPQSLNVSSMQSIADIRIPRWLMGYVPQDEVVSTGSGQDKLPA